MIKNDRAVERGISRGGASQEIALRPLRRQSAPPSKEAVTSSWVSSQMGSADASSVLPGPVRLSRLPRRSEGSVATVEQAAPFERFDRGGEGGPIHAEES